MVKLGDKVKDVVSGFTGIATARTEWLAKCVRIQVSPQGLHEGKPIESQMFDEEQLEVLAVQSIVINKPKQTGGGRDDKSVTCRPSASR